MTCFNYDKTLSYLLSVLVKWNLLRTILFQNYETRIYALLPILFTFSKINRSSWEWLWCQCVIILDRKSYWEFSNSRPICIYLCHSQMIVMATMVFFAEVPEWQWHFIPTLDSLYLTATSQVRLYISLQCVFTVFCFKSTFDPEVPFDEIPLYKAHPVTVSP